MLSSDQEPSSGHGDAPSSPAPEPSASEGQPGVEGEQPAPLSLHEFLSKLMTSAETRSAFEADPHATLEDAGLGDVHATDILHATSLMLDYAPVDVVRDYDRSMHDSFEKFAAISSGAVPISELTSSSPQHNNMMELSMLNKGWDHEPDHQGSPQPAPPPAHHDDQRVNIVEKDSYNGIDIHDNHLLSGNGLNVLSKDADDDHDHKGPRPDHGHHHKHDHDDDQVNIVEKDSHNGIDIHDNHLLSGNSVNILSGDDPDTSSVSSAISSVTAAFSNGPEQLHELASHLPASGGLPNPAEGPAAIGGALENGAQQFAAATSGVPVVGQVTASMASGAETLNAALSQAASGGLPSPSEAPTAIAGAMENGAQQLAAATSGVPVVGQVTATMASGSETFAGTLSGLASGGLPNPADGPAAIGGALENGAQQFAAATSGVPVVGQVTASMASGAETLNAALSGAASGSLPNPTDGPAAITDALSGAASGHLPAPSEVPVVGSVGGNLPGAGDPPAGVHTLPAVPGDLPAAGNLPTGAITGAFDHVTEHLDAASPQVDAVTSHLPVHEVTSHLPVGEVTSHVPSSDTVLDALPTHQAPLNVVAQPAEDGLHHVEAVGGHDLGLDLH